MRSLRDVPLFSFNHGGNSYTLRSVFGDCAEKSAEVALLFFGEVSPRVSTGGAQVQWATEVDAHCASYFTTQRYCSSTSRWPSSAMSRCALEEYKIPSFFYVPAWLATPTAADALKKDVGHPIQFWEWVLIGTGVDFSKWVGGGGAN